MEQNKTEIECPDCVAMVPVSVEKYEIVICPTCGGEYEFLGDSLVRDES